ncbi:MAG: hypothetical protein LBB94_10745 [Clostridiales bacterium]|nr:hypothetical protein [Clostridiales bacterium]
MRTLTIYTDTYLEELAEATSGFIRRVKRPGQGYIKLYYERFDTEGFYSFLEWAAFQENAALKGIPKLAELTRGFISPDIGLRNIRILDEYIKKNRTLHVEGYVHFRMAEYNDYLNRLLYGILRRAKV